MLIYGLSTHPYYLGSSFETGQWVHFNTPSILPGIIYNLSSFSSINSGFSSYQFLDNITQKHKQIDSVVSPSLAFALRRKLKERLEQLGRIS
jgi:hypothetical protein